MYFNLHLKITNSQTIKSNPSFRLRLSLHLCGAVVCVLPQRIALCMLQCHSHKSTTASHNNNQRTHTAYAKKKNGAGTFFHPLRCFGSWFKMNHIMQKKDCNCRQTSKRAASILSYLLEVPRNPSAWRTLI